MKTAKNSRKQRLGQRTKHGLMGLLALITVFCFIALTDFRLQQVGASSETTFTSNDAQSGQNENFSPSETKGDTTQVEIAFWVVVAFFFGALITRIFARPWYYHRRPSRYYVVRQKDYFWD